MEFHRNTLCFGEFTCFVVFEIPSDFGSNPFQSKPYILSYRKSFLGYYSNTKCKHDWSHIDKTNSVVFDLNMTEK